MICKKSSAREALNEWPQPVTAHRTGYSDSGLGLG